MRVQREHHGTSKQHPTAKEQDQQNEIHLKIQIWHSHSNNENPNEDQTHHAFKYVEIASPSQQHFTLICRGGEKLMLLL